MNSCLSFSTRVVPCRHSDCKITGRFSGCVSVEIGRFVSAQMAGNEFVWARQKLGQNGASVWNWLIFETVHHGAPWPTTYEITDFSVFGDYNLCVLVPFVPIE